MKKLLKKVTSWVKAKVKLVTPGAFAVKSAALGLIILTSILFSIEAIGMSVNFNDPWILVFALIVVLAAVLLAYINSWLIKQLYQIPKPYKIALVLSIILLTIVRLNDERFALFLILVFSLLGAGLGILLGGNFGKLTKPKKVVTITGLGLGLVGLSTLIYYGSLKGLEMDQQINAASLTADQVSPLSLPSPAEPGNYDVLTFTYGSGDDLRREEYAEGVTYETESIDGRAFLDGWTKFGGWWREKYWGFDSKELPLNARVWMPEGEGPFPLALIVHGNHPMQDYSDPGYDYLGEHLASRGFILASVDENFINGSWTDLFGGLDTENDARGWILLEHLRVWKEWNEDSSHPLFGKVDMENLALMGHSRGGEAIGHAAMLNALDYYPDDAKVKLDYHFNLKSVVAIAPVDGQYKPGGSGTKFENVDYLTFHGAQDADVTSFSGSKQFTRVSFTDSLYHFKSAVYIAGANHGQFNTSWGDNDILATFKSILNFGQLMPKEEQELVAKVYIGAFLEATLKGKKGYLPLFMDARKGKEWLPEEVYLTQFEDSEMTFWEDYDEDFQLGTFSKSGQAIGKNLSVWREGEVRMNYGLKGTRAVFLGWDYGELGDAADSLWEGGNLPSLPDSVLGSYTLELDSSEVRPDSTSVLFFALAESSESSNPRSGGKWIDNTNDDNESANNEELENSDSSEKPESEEDEDDKPEEVDRPDPPLNFTILLKDASGAKVSFPLAKFSHLQRQIKARVLKMDFLDEDDHSENIFQTFFFDLGKMKEINPAFNPALLQEIRFEFDQNESGVIILDDLGFTNPLK